MPYADPERARAYWKARDKSDPARVRQKRASTVRWLKDLPRTSPFYAIDSEGGSTRMFYEADDGKIYQPHKSFLWGCSDQSGSVDWLFQGRPLGTEEICQWLRRQRELTAKAIFISFSFSYDVAQIVGGLPYEKAWELQRGVEFEPDEGEEPGQRQIVFWKQWGFSYRKGKLFSLYWFRENSRPYTYVGGKRRLNHEGVIRIYDVFGFFQSSFLNAIRTMPGTCTAVEYDCIKSGKKDRGSFKIADIARIKEYNRLELVVLCRMMDRLRKALYDNDIKVTTWFGAGSIASALLKREGTREHLYEVKSSTITDWQRVAHHAYFGGRIELLQQGNTARELYSYDISSAYPAAATGLSSMSGGRFELVRKPNIHDIEQFDRLSIVHVRTKGFPANAPFYPLPYRMPTGAILFPNEVRGWYMRDEVLAAFEYARKYKVLGGFHILQACRFRPSNDTKPFAFLQTLFDFRASLPKEDITQIVIKLGINSVYGKLAQSIGQHGKVPVYASPWHASAITAWTRARLLMAALHDPSAIVMFATDGIISTRPLPLEISQTKTLGAWEADVLPQGGVFMQSGFYAISGAKGWYAKSRGFRPNNIGGDVIDFIRNGVPRLWAEDKAKFEFPYTNYMTLGASTASRDLWKHVGEWSDGTRDLDLTSAGTKRDVSLSAKDRRRRAKELVPTFPNSANMLLVDDKGEMILSAPSKPDWLDADLGVSERDETEQETILAGFA